MKDPGFDFQLPRLSQVVPAEKTAVSVLSFIPNNCTTKETPTSKAQTKFEC